MKTLILLLSIPAFGQPTFSALSSDAVTRTAARVGFSVTGSGDYYVQYGTTTSYGHRIPAGNGASVLVQQLTGMAPATLYHWRACNEAYTPPTGCSSDQEMTTAADTLPTVAPAVMPTLMTTTYPATITGPPLAVDADCGNFTTQLAAAAALDGNLNHEIRFPLGTVCVGATELPAKTGANPTGGGYIILRPDVADSALPPEGTRITRDWETNLPLFVNAELGYREAASDSGTCSPVEYYWDTSQGGANKYKACLTLNTWTLISASTGYTSGSGAISGSGCVQGRYYFDTAGTANQSLYRCVTFNGATRWIRIPASGAGDDFVLANYYGAALKGYRFMGLRFQPGDMNGSAIAAMLSLGRGGGAISNAIIDRCIFYTGSTASTMRAVGMDGAGTALIDSFIDLRTVPTASPYNPEVVQFAVSIGAGSGPFKVVNNYIRGAGLLLFVTDNSTVVPRDDFEIRRNTFTYNDDHRCGGPTSDGICRDVRSPIEFKRGRRVWMDGNLFENYWSTVGTYPAIIVTPRASGVTGMDGNTYQIRDFTITNNVFRNGTGFLQVLAGETNADRTTWPTERFTIRNNVFSGIGNAVISQYNGYNDARGTILWHGGLGDVIFENNTVYKNTGSAPAFLAITDQRAFSGLRWRNNILWLTQHGIGGGNGIRYSGGNFPDGTSPTGSTAATRLNKTAMRIPTAQYEFTNNAIVPTTTGDTAAEEPGYPAGNIWPGDNTTGESALNFVTAAGNNFRLKYTSAYAPNNLGTDLDAIRQASGETAYPRVRAITTGGATLSYTAPDIAVSCSVDHGTSATFVSATRTSDTPGGVSPRNVALTGYGSGVTVFFRVNCAQPVTGSFVTR